MAITKGCIIWVALVLAGAIVHPVVAEEQDVSGTWIGENHGLHFEADVTFVLIQEGNEVLGWYSQKQKGSVFGPGSPELTDLPMKGTITGDKLVLLMGSDQATRLDLMVSGSEMHGYSMWRNEAPLRITMHKKPMPATTTGEQGAAGTWTGTQHAGSFAAEVTMVLGQNGQNVTGTFSRKVTRGRANQMEIVDLPISGTLTGHELALMAGKQWRFRFTVNRDEMHGYSRFADKAPLVVNMTRTK